MDFTDYEALILDWDGTLVDSQPLNYRCLAETLSLYGIALDREWYRSRLGTSGSDLLAELGVTVPYGEVLARCGELIIGSVRTLRPFPVAVGWVEAARDHGLRCAVASGGGGPVVRAGLEATGLERLFDVVVTREDVARGKPAPDVFMEAARRLGVRPARCLVVEDADEGLEGARAAGMDAVDVRPFVVSAW
ncbi:HAD family hydrolase [Streptomyces sp. NPDC000405]|uniref:HAD family hydrolase n=1 Tax=Streptomyces sp. NPDC000405 TaxID=3161033 RepID=UPI00398CEE6F